MTYQNNEMMVQIGFEKVLISTFIDSNICIETVINSPDFIYNWVADYHHTNTKTTQTTYIDF